MRKLSIYTILFLLNIGQNTLSAKPKLAAKPRHKAYSIGVEQGLLLTLPQRGELTSILHAVVTASYYYGLMCSMQTDSYWAELGIRRNGFTATVAYTDAALLKEQGVGYGGRFGLAGDFSVYTQVPLRIGYSFKTFLRQLQLQPFIELGYLHTSHANTSFTSYSMSGAGGSGGTDSTSDQLALSLSRPNKNAISYGAGFKIKYNIRRFLISLQVEYFQANKIWTTENADYIRYSRNHGYLHTTNTFNLKAKTLMAGIALGIRL